MAEAVDMADAARLTAARGVRSMVGFTYRRVPAIALAKQLVDDGRLGTIRHVRAQYLQYLQDWIVDPQFPLVWRLEKDKAGSGALGDIGAHVIDLAQHLLGSSISGVSGLTETFVKERPLPARSSGLPASGTAATGPVTVDDAALFTARFASGAIGAFEATRFASGRTNATRIEINGSEGSLAFDFASMDELHFHDHTTPPETAGFRRILVTESGHPYVGRWWPPSYGLGYEHAFADEIADLVEDIAAGRSPSPSFDDGSQVQRVLDAVEQSAAKDRLWTPVPPPLTFQKEPPWHDRSPCSPSSGPTCPSRRSAGWRPSGAATDWRSPAEAITSRSTRRWPTRRTCRAGSGCWPSTTSRSSPCPTTSSGRRCATTRSTSATARSCPPGCGGPASRRACAGMRRRRWPTPPARLLSSACAPSSGSPGRRSGEGGRDVPAGPAVDGRRRPPGHADRWNPVLDVFDEVGVRFAHEVHPSEIAYDCWTTVRALEAVGHRPASGLNWDPSHFVRQDLDPVGFLWDFRDRIHHIDRKDAKRQVGNGRNGRMRSHLAWADPRRGWDFVSTGHGDVPWKACFRMLNTIGYDGLLSIEWEDTGMDRLVGAPDRASPSGPSRRSLRGRDVRAVRGRRRRLRPPGSRDALAAAPARV